MEGVEILCEPRVGALVVTFGRPDKVTSLGWISSSRKIVTMTRNGGNLGSEEGHTKRFCV